MNNKAMTFIHSVADADTLFQNSDQNLTIIYKHSPICDLSAMAIDEVYVFIESLPDTMSIHQVDVISDRTASQRIEALSGIRHESPQILFIQNGKCVYHASHRKIRNAELVQNFKTWATV